MPTDVNSLAAASVSKATEDESAIEAAPPRKKNRAAVALGRKGGKKGGKARAEALSAEKRREIAAKAAAARWKKSRG